MNKRRVILLSLSLIISTAYIYSSSPPWYTRLVVFLQEKLWNPFVQRVRRLFGMPDTQQAVQVAAITEQIRQEKETVEFTAGGLDKSRIGDIQIQNPIIIGLIEGLPKVVTLIQEELLKVRNKFLTPKNIKEIFKSIESKIFTNPQIGGYVSGFALVKKKICIFNIGTSHTMLFKKSDNTLRLMFTTVKHLISDKDERDRLIKKAQDTHSQITVQTHGRFRDEPTKHGMYFDTKQKKWVLEGLDASRFLGYSYQKEQFDSPIREVLAEPDVTCFLLEPGTYYIVIATESTQLTPQIIQNAFSELYSHTLNTGFLVSAIERQHHQNPIEGKYIVVRLVIR